MSICQKITVNTDHDTIKCYHSTAEWWNTKAHEIWKIKKKEIKKEFFLTMYAILQHFGSISQYCEKLL